MQIHGDPSEWVKAFKPVTIGAFIRQRRLERGLTNAQFAKACEITRGTVYVWERQTYIAPKHHKRIAKCLGVTRDAVREVNSRRS